MIQAQELRIGNWIKGIKGFRQIVHMDFLILYGEEKNEYAEADQPIPLSADLLEKCGFILSEDFGDEKSFQLPNKISGFGVTLDHDELAFYFYQRGNFYTLIYDEVHFKYLHQLQNIFYALTGEELVINLK